MDFELIQNELVKAFQISKDDITFFGRQTISELFVYSLKI